MESGAERTAIAQDVLGRSSQDMAALLNMSSEETEAMKQSLYDLGGVMSSDTVDASAQYEDALLNIQTAMQGMKTQAMQDFIPMIADVMDGVVQLMTGDDGGFQTIADGIEGFASSMLDRGKTFVNNLVTGLNERLPSLIQKGSDLVAKLGAKLIEKAPDLIQKGIVLVAKLQTGIIKNLPAIATGAVKIITTLAASLVEAIPKLVAKIPKIVTSIKDEFLSVDWKQLGIDILKGIAEGLVNVAGAIGSAIKESASGLLDAFKEKLGIHSPSRVFRDEVGYNIMRGLADGITGNQDLYDDALGNTLYDGLASDMTVNANGVATSAQNNTALETVIGLLGTIADEDNKDYYFSINGRQFALATAGDINNAIGQLQKKEARK